MNWRTTRALAVSAAALGLLACGVRERSGAPTAGRAASGAAESAPVAIRADLPRWYTAALAELAQRPACVLAIVVPPEDRAARAQPDSPTVAERPELGQRIDSLLRESEHDGERAWLRELGRQPCPDPAAAIAAQLDLLLMSRVPEVRDVFLQVDFACVGPGWVGDRDDENLLLIDASGRRLAGTRVSYGSETDFLRGVRELLSFGDALLQLADLQRTPELLAQVEALRADGPARERARAWLREHYRRRAAALTRIRNETGDRELRAHLLTVRDAAYASVHPGHTADLPLLDARRAAAAAPGFGGGFLVHEAEAAGRARSTMFFLAR